MEIIEEIVEDEITVNNIKYRGYRITTNKQIISFLIDSGEIIIALEDVVLTNFTFRYQFYSIKCIIKDNRLILQFKTNLGKLKCIMSKFKDEIYNPLCIVEWVDEYIHNKHLIEKFLNF